MGKLKNLLFDLGADAELARNFETDPDAVLAKYSIDEKAAEAIKAGDLDALRRFSGLDELHLTKSTIKAYR
ncbi:hypothetical protein HFP89_07395 [Wenzhouxiangella sp. XN79A]|uniref:hypothetical protein n=1 Tax=Wenzhouxiangella sp. XN79A TaxID=2724193 RepID=UPI00144A8246|nr:hypothetical protein [Wenzhouxiangella sp. XN79A]NKI34986.1 hypothetical protein [Wenzhouxiangella sp. XN79A]